MTHRRNLISAIYSAGLLARELGYFQVADRLLDVMDQLDAERLAQAPTCPTLFVIQGSKAS